MKSYLGKNQQVHKNQLRSDVKKELIELRTKVDYLLTAETYHTFWEQLHMRIIGLEDEKEKGAVLAVENQLMGLPLFIDTWIRNAVESRERFEFFIKVKAEEIDSGDDKKNYYWALIIRHDQMVGLVLVLQKLIGHVQRFCLMDVAEVLDDPVFLGMMDYSIEDQVYLEAERVHNEREAT